MIREWFDETRHMRVSWTRFAEIQFPETVVHFFKTEVETLPYFPAVNDIGERLEKHPYEMSVRYEDVLPNLRWLLPMAFEDPDAKFALLTPVAANDNAAPTATQVEA